MEELARLLSVERRLLQLLLFKLVEGSHLLEQIRETELYRSLLVHDLAVRLDVPYETLTLSALARHSCEPFGTIFTDHHFALLALAAEIEDLQMARDGRPIPSLADFLQ